MPTIARFLEAQNSPSNGYADALAELHAERKVSHWIWYIFPQLKGLGTSPMAQNYGIRDLREAREYAEHPVLCARLIEITAVVQRHLAAGASPENLMGGRTDAMKLVSSMTLFARAAQDRALQEACEDVLTRTETQGYTRCAYTLRAS
ncbi:hypothetical protein TSACC_2310 [Terrimicrobium sacchariphilum]|uniref:Calpastatin n=1 Tax=Terrimicrobium sacchariphilum TaxID=690879 RepID=A0A146G258_TERSA|nr:DUF1810 family protein [Terrimicrobium sacchariphilum]GAT31915.1 hypothetical protein TSACC_2310 [Terrimicrobium sacchariphilum]